MGSQSYRYGPLRQTGEFRLLSLKPGTGRVLEGEFIDCNNSYEAVSYVWGGNEKADVIHIRGRTLPITMNLSLVLRDLRSSTESRVLWIDAICINQEDVHERGQQVQLMRDIYSNAQRVLFHISRPTELTDFVMDSLEALRIQSTKYPWANEDDLRAQWKRVQSYFEETTWGTKQRQVAGLEHILSQPWFSRVWIMQEVANARDALVYCGSKSIPASIFALSPRLIPVSKPDANRYQSVLDLMPGSMRRYGRPDYRRDLHSLLLRFASAQASESYDRVYGLLGMCPDALRDATLKPDYTKPGKALLRDTIGHICGCDVRLVPVMPYANIEDLISRLRSVHSTMLLELLRVSDTKNALSLLANYGNHVTVTWEILEFGTTDVMHAHGVTQLLLGQRWAYGETTFRTPSTSIIWAVTRGHVELVQKMIEKGDNAEARRIIASHALYAACEAGQEAIVRVLLTTDVDVEEVDSNGYTPLMVAAKQGHANIVRVLRNKGASLERRSHRFLETPLLRAVSTDNEAMARLLLELGADTEARNQPGDVPLTIAVRKNNREAVRLLLEYGADRQATIKTGGTPVQLAMELKNETVARMLLGKEERAKPSIGRGFAGLSVNRSIPLRERVS
jgi:ankyrin repeat protein